MTRLLRRKELAERWGMTEAGISKLVMQRRIPFVKVTGSKHGPIRFSEDAIIAHELANSIEPVARV